jgi:hypothetical protein
MTSESPQPDVGSAPISFLGLSIQRKTDVLAATAFVLALAGTLFQAFNYVRGARVSLYAPEFVTLFFDTYPNGDSVVRFATTMNYVNSGEASYGAVIRRERLEYLLGSEKYEQNWQSFQEIDRADTSIVFKNQGIAKPTPIPGASAISHSTVFAPRPLSCAETSAACNQFRNYLSKSEFTKALGTTDKIKLIFYSQLVGDSSELKTECVLKIDPGLIALLVMNNWYFALCY